MKYRDENGVFQDLYLPPTGDTLPIGSEVDYDGDIVPYGWEEVESDVKILWSNRNPNNDFTAQTITLLSDDYDILEIFYRTDDTTNISFSTKTLKGFGFQLIFNSSSSSNAWVRRCSYVSSTEFSVSNCTWTADETSHNDQCVPLYIIGYKTGLFS